MTNCHMSNLTQTNMNNKDLAGCDFSFSDMDYAYFSKADLEGSVLNDVDATGAIFDQAKMTLVLMNHSCFNRAQFKQADMSQVSMRHVQAVGADFSYANMCEASLKLSILNDANFSYADMRGVDLRQCLIKDTKFTGTVFEPLVCGEIVYVNNVAYILFDSRGYVLSMDNTPFRTIYAGCREYNSSYWAIKHWGSANYHTPLLGKQYVESIRRLDDFLDTV